MHLGVVNSVGAFEAYAGDDINQIIWFNTRPQSAISSVQITQLISIYIQSNRVSVDKYTQSGFLLTFFWPSENATKSLSQEILRKKIQNCFMFYLFFKEQKNDLFEYFFIQPFLGKINVNFGHKNANSNNYVYTFSWISWDRLFVDIRVFWQFFSFLKKQQKPWWTNLGL